MSSRERENDKKERVTFSAEQMNNPSGVPSTRLTAFVGTSDTSDAFVRVNSPLPVNVMLFTSAE